MHYIHYFYSKIGRITMASDGESLTGLWFEGQRYYADTLSMHYEEKVVPVFEQALHWLEIYFSGNAPSFIPPLKTDSTRFREEVWRILLTIPFGQTMTYGEIADRVAVRMSLRKMSARAVGGAVGHNPISLMIPCHRVIGAKGDLTGYAGGLDKKKWLLAMEKQGRTDLND